MPPLVSWTCPGNSDSENEPDDVFDDNALDDDDCSYYGSSMCPRQ